CTLYKAGINISCVRLHINKNRLYTEHERCIGRSCKRYGRSYQFVVAVQPRSKISGMQCSSAGGKNHGMRCSGIGRKRCLKGVNCRALREIIGFKDRYYRFDIICFYALPAVWNKPSASLHVGISSILYCSEATSRRSISIVSTSSLIWECESHSSFLSLL